ncbi:MAG: nitroreductase [Gammaproteobacteria bacterium]
MDVLSAITDRISTRKYLDKPVSEELMKKIIETARWAPSGTNCQPWQVIGVTGKTRDAISADLLAHVSAGGAESAHYHYYPQDWHEPYLQRRRTCGYMLYEAQGVARDDKPARMKSMLQNFDFFGAPAGMFFYIPRVMAKGSWVDMGMFIQSVMLAARGLGLESCPQFALAMYPEVVEQHISPPENHSMVCGLSIGYGDSAAAVNNYRTERLTVEEILTCYD